METSKLIAACAVAMTVASIGTEDAHGMHNSPYVPSSTAPKDMPIYSQPSSYVPSSTAPEGMPVYSQPSSYVASGTATSEQPSSVEMANINDNNAGNVMYHRPTVGQKKNPIVRFLSFVSSKLFGCCTDGNAAD